MQLAISKGIQEFLEMTPEERLAHLERTFAILTRLALSVDERMDEHRSALETLRETDANDEARIAALADAHIRLEALVAKFVEWQKGADERARQNQAWLDRHREVHKRIDAKLARLAAALEERDEH